MNKRTFLTAMGAVMAALALPRLAVASEHVPTTALELEQWMEANFDCDSTLSKTSTVFDDGIRLTAENFALKKPAEANRSPHCVYAYSIAKSDDAERQLVQAMHKQFSEFLAGKSVKPRLVWRRKPVFEGDYFQERGPSSLSKEQRDAGMKFWHIDHPIDGVQRLSMRFAIIGMREPIPCDSYKVQGARPKVLQA
tara:strand:- start:1089 stop:1673 length:585 start_codon:yes stop_codon:yes gene_type:complete